MAGGSVCTVYAVYTHVTRSPEHGPVVQPVFLLAEGWNMCCWCGLYSPTVGMLKHGLVVQSVLLLLIC